MKLHQLPYDEVAVFAIPLTVPFRGITIREGIALRQGDRWAEFAPFVEYRPPEAARWLASAHEQLAGTFPAAVRDTIAVNCIVPAVSPAKAVELVRASGCTTAKVKVAAAGQSLDDDVERVAAVRDALGAQGKLRIDSNGAWSVAEAVDAITRLAPYQLEYVEQPCATVPELAQVRRRVAVAIAADESVRRADDPLAVARAQAADIVVLKVAPLGGVTAAARIGAACGLHVVVSSAVDTSIGLFAGVALAAALPQLPFACGLDTCSLLSGDLVHDRLTSVAGQLPVREPTVNPAAVRRHRAPADRVAWWHEHLISCYTHLEGR